MTNAPTTNMPQRGGWLIVLAALALVGVAAYLLKVCWFSLKWTFAVIELVGKG